MIYCQTVNKECIVVHPLDDMNSAYSVDLIKYGDIPMFAVYVDDGEEEWLWEFEMNTPSDYERVKMNIFDAIFECSTMCELTEALDDIFVCSFGDILIEDECDECDGCEGCCMNNAE